MHFDPYELAALVAVISFAAGLNVYATVVSLGLLARFGVLVLPPQLHELTSWPVIAVAGVLFGVEFFADKIPAFDLVWNALHTFVRIPVAALLAYHATAGLPLWEQLAATAAGGLIALAAHGGKIGIRAAVTPLPEPISNAALSFGEDAFVAAITWLVSRHPYLAATIVLVLVAIIVILVRCVVRAVKNLFRGAEHAVSTT
jgi:Domain of unknown function (DUF4126)